MMAPKVKVTEVCPRCHQPRSILEYVVALTVEVRKDDPSLDLNVARARALELLTPAERAEYKSAGRKSRKARTPAIP